MGSRTGILAEMPMDMPETTAHQKHFKHCTPYSLVVMIGIVVIVITIRFLTIISIAIADILTIGQLIYPKEAGICGRVSTDIEVGIPFLLASTAWSSEFSLARQAF